MYFVVLFGVFYNYIKLVDSFVQAFHIFSGFLTVLTFERAVLASLGLSWGTGVLRERAMLKCQNILILFFLSHLSFIVFCIFKILLVAYAYGVIISFERCHSFIFPYPPVSWWLGFCVCAQLLSHVRLFATLWTVACEASLSMGILQARILEWVAMPSSRGSSNPEIEPRSPRLQADSLPCELPFKSNN